MVGSVVNGQSVTTTSTPIFQGVQNVAADLDLSTTTSGDVLVNPASKIARVNSGLDTSANTISQYFGDDTGGVAGIRCNNGVMEAQDSGGAWAGFPSAGGGITPLYAYYATNTAQASTRNTTVVVDYEDKVYDPDNCVTTGAAWKFIPNVDGGIYFVHARVVYAGSANWATGGYGATLQIMKNTTEMADHIMTAAGAISAYQVHNEVFAIVAADSTDYIQIKRWYNTPSSTIALDTNTNRNQVAIFRIA